MAEVYKLSDEERAAVRRGLEEMRQGKFATDEEVAAVFDRYRSFDVKMVKLADANGPSE